MLMVRKIVLSIVALLAVGFAAYAQTRQVSGTVKDEAGNAIVGASVIVAHRERSDYRGGRQLQDLSPRERYAYRFVHRLRGPKR